MNGTLFFNPLRCKFYHAIPQSSRDFIKLQECKTKTLRLRSEIGIWIWLWLHFRGGGKGEPWETTQSKRISDGRTGLIDLYNATPTMLMVGQSSSDAMRGIVMKDWGIIQSAEMHLQIHAQQHLGQVGNKTEIYVTDRYQLLNWRWSPNATNTHLVLKATQLGFNPEWAIRTGPWPPP